MKSVMPTCKHFFARSHTQNRKGLVMQVTMPRARARGTTPKRLQKSARTRRSALRATRSQKISVETDRHARLVGVVWTLEAVHRASPRPRDSISRPAARGPWDV